MTTRGDEARATVLVEVPVEAAFRIFTEEIDRWWRQGPRYRIAGRGRSVLALEPRAGGRLYERFAGDRVVETGRVTVWEPPARLVFEWRAANFAPAEKTEVEVRFAATDGGTLVTVSHRGWAKVRPDHPARHGLPPAPFLRMMGMWWGELMTSLRELAATTT